LCRSLWLFSSAVAASGGAAEQAEYDTELDAVLESATAKVERLLEAHAVPAGPEELDA
jgi:hypothetical protein